MSVCYKRDYLLPRNVRQYKIIVSLNPEKSIPDHRKLHIPMFSMNDVIERKEAMNCQYKLYEDQLRNVLES